MSHFLALERANRFLASLRHCQVWRQGRRVANVAITAWQTPRTDRHGTRPFQGRRAVSLSLLRQLNLRKYV